MRKDTKEPLRTSRVGTTRRRAMVTSTNPTSRPLFFFFFNDPPPTEISPLPLHDALPISDDAVNALEEQNVEVAAGSVGQPPIQAGQQLKISVRAVGRLTEPAQFDDIILKTNKDGTIVRLKDVGHAELGAEDYGSDLEYNGHESVGIGI